MHFRFKKWLKVLGESKRNCAMVGLKGMRFRLSNLWTIMGLMVNVLQKEYRVLEKINLWPSGGLDLECLKPKCFNCQVAAECKICVKRHKCELCKIPRQYSGAATCTKNRRCDAYAYREENCRRVVIKNIAPPESKRGNVPLNALLMLIFS